MNQLAGFLLTHGVLVHFSFLLIYYFNELSLAIHFFLFFFSAYWFLGSGFQVKLIVFIDFFLFLTNFTNSSFLFLFLGGFFRFLEFGC